MADEPEELGATLSLETAQLRAELGELNRLGGSFGSTIARAFSSAISGGRKFSDVLRGLALSLSHQALTAALKPLGNLFGGLLGSIAAPGGGATPFAKGGIVNSPLLFPMGVAGEAGAEAILPLARGGSGRLGVRAGGGGGVNVTVNIAARDVDSFRQSQSQIAASVARAVDRGQRNL